VLYRLSYLAAVRSMVAARVMEFVDNANLLVIPGAMEAGLDAPLFWGSLAVALVIAGLAHCAGQGHAAVHETGIHGGPSPRLLAIIVVLAAVFGTSVLIAEASCG
jgi:hypothetical protein